MSRYRSRRRCRSTRQAERRRRKPETVALGTGTRKVSTKVMVLPTLSDPDVFAFEVIETIVGPLPVAAERERGVALIAGKIGECHDDRKERLIIAALDGIACGVRAGT